MSDLIPRNILTLDPKESPVYAVIFGEYGKERHISLHMTEEEAVSHARFNFAFSLRGDEPQPNRVVLMTAASYLAARAAIAEAKDKAERDKAAE